MNDIPPSSQLNININKRSSNLELYRIVCMLFIVAHHYVVNSGLAEIDGPMINFSDSLQTLYLWSFGMWGKTGINCFLMITGFFMCKSSITMKKFLKLILQIYLYKFLIFIIFLLCGYESITPIRMLQLFSPIWGINTNFTSCFVIFWLTIPFWNILIHNLTQKMHFFLLSLLLICYTILGSIPKFNITFNYVTWFGVIYLLASYIRLYPHPIFCKKTLWGWLTIASILIALVSMYVMSHFLGGRYAQFFVNDSNKFFAVLVAVCSFLWFKNIKIPYNKFINSIGASTFGVFLIHTNSNAMRTWLWYDVVDCVGHYNLPLVSLVLYSIGVVLVVFSVCVVIDMMRIKFIEKPFFKWYGIRIEK